MVGNGENLEKALKKIGERIENLSDSRSLPVQFVRDVHRQWKADGRKVAGKPRHSDRCLEDFLREQKTPVKALTPKLVGKTNIQAKDAAALIRVFLIKWPAFGDNEGDIAYRPFLSEEEIFAVANYIEGRIENSNLPSSSVSSPESLPPALPGEDIGRIITRFFEDADALITVSPEQTLIAKPKGELIGFRNLMNALMSIERRDKKARPLIWVLDLGDQLFEDLDARRKYLNVQSLITRFKALKRFDERGYEPRWEWLQSRAVIVLLDTVGFSEEGNFSGSNREARPIFGADNVTLNAVGTDWLASNEFRALYGRNLDQLHQRSFSVAFNACADWTEPCKWPEARDIRYFGFATFEDKNDTFGRGIELPSLPNRYAEGFRAVAMAGAHVLGLTYQMPEEQTPEEALSGEDVVDQLHYLGFRILRLNEFLENY